MLNEHLQREIVLTWVDKRQVGNLTRSAWAGFKIFGSGIC